jgi:8-amino-7-oxononanoate synthase
MDVFEKCFSFTKSDEVKAMGLYTYFKEISRNMGPVVIMEGKEVLMAGSNNYLGLSVHPEVIQAAKDAIDQYGTSCSGSRYLNGTLQLHRELEDELADYLEVDSSLLFTTGFLTNQGVIPTIAQRNEYLLTDKDNHASIVAGTLIAKSMGTNIVRYLNNDMSSLESQLKKLPLDSPKLIVSDGVFSMSGFVVNLPEMVKLAKKYQARLMLDEAHSIGVLGKNGIGTCSHYGFKNGEDVDLLMGTFSKSLASVGGFIAGKSKVIDYIKHNSQALIFSASMPPAAVAAVQAAIKIIRREPERTTRILEIGDYIRSGLKSEGFNLLESCTPIVPIIIGDDILTFKFCLRMLELGVFANAVISPGVPQGMQLIRTSYIGTLTNSQLDRIIEVITKVGKELKVI